MQNLEKIWNEFQNLEKIWNEFLELVDSEYTRERMNAFMEKGNKTAAKDVRMALMDIAKKCKEVREAIQTVKNTQ